MAAPLNREEYQLCRSNSCLRRSDGLGRITLQIFVSDAGDHFVRRCPDCAELNDCPPLRVARTIGEADWFGPVA